jgi:hypothetical protein
LKVLAVLTLPGSTGVKTILPSSSGFIMRRLYLEVLADVGEGISGDVVADLSGNTNLTRHSR